MREILFRGKRLDNGEWVEGAFCPKNSEGDIPCIIVYNGTLAGWWFEVDPATVGQFTGMLDKNGKRIFEGDVVAVRYDTVLEMTGQVVFLDGAFQIAGPDDIYACLWFRPDEMEAIGTIYDNPELLEVTPDE